MNTIRNTIILLLCMTSTNTTHSHIATLATIPLSIATTWYGSKEQEKAIRFSLTLQARSQAGDVVSERKLKEFQKHYTISRPLDLPTILSATSMTALFADKLSMSAYHVGSTMHYTTPATQLLFIAIGCACSSILSMSYECYKIKKAIKAAQAITRDTLLNEAQEAHNLLKRLQ